MSRDHTTSGERHCSRCAAHALSCIRSLLGILVILAAMSAGLASLSGCVKKKDQLPITADSVSVPYQKFEKTSLFFYDGSTRKWRLDALHMKKDLDSKGLALVVPVRLTIYDSLSQARTTVVADSGTTTSTLENFTGWGNVYITTHDHMIIKTQKLFWNKNTHKVTSDTYVQIQTANGDVLRGKGLDAEEDFSRWSFRSHVTGEFPHFRDRMGSEDGSF
jgi:LPS export ABC transporter protein LptC